jgi:hypothetical protein
MNDSSLAGSCHKVKTTTRQQQQAGDSPMIKRWRKIIREGIGASPCFWWVQQGRTAPSSLRHRGLVTRAGPSSASKEPRGDPHDSSLDDLQPESQQHFAFLQQEQNFSNQRQNPMQQVTNRLSEAPVTRRNPAALNAARPSRAVAKIILELFDFSRSSWAKNFDR